MLVWAVWMTIWSLIFMAAFRGGEKLVRGRRR